MKVFLYGLGLCLLMTACNKVDQHYDLVAGQPWILGSYPTTYYVGDTMTISGLLFIGEGGTLQVGAVQPSFLSVTKTAGAPGTSAVDSQEIVRFLITKEMGVGNNIPVTLTARGLTIKSPSITIRQLTGLLARTDTTLVATQIASWQPANLSDYQSQNIPLIIGSSVSSNGSIYFDNPWGVFSVIGAAVQPVLSVGSQLSDQNGPFTVNKVLGSAISFDGSTLAFSVAVSDNSDTVNNYVFRFCTMDIGSKAVTTLNRTLELKGIPNQSGSPGAFTGAVAQLNLIAAGISADVNGNWYFTNIYSVPSSGSDMGFWYSSAADNPGSGDNELDNICELGTDGNLKSLFSFQPPNSYRASSSPFRTPGYPVDEIGGTLISQDGGVAFISTNYGESLLNVAVYDLNQQVLLSAPPAEANYRFISYDTSTVTGEPAVGSGPFTVPIGFTYNRGAPNPNFALPNGTILYGGAASVYAFNVLSQTFYCYAGTEVGLLSGPPVVQNQATGPAKYVNFNLNGNWSYFDGIDSKGAVYYFTAPPGSSYYGQPVYGGPLTFYKLYSKK